MNERVSLRWTILLFLGFVLGPISLVTGAEKVASPVKQEKAASGTNFADSLSFTSRKEPIHVRARELEYRYNEKIIFYRGDVVVVQGDATLKSDVLTVTLEEPAPTDGTAASSGGQPATATGQSESVTSRQRLKEIVAEGHVDITSGERHATSKKAVFNEPGRTVVLTGNVILQEGGNRVTGEKVTIYLDEKRSVVEGADGKPPETILIPQQQEDGKKGGKKP
jgi:lipopolysaccharide export system protein LptA